MNKIKVLCIKNFELKIAEQLNESTTWFCVIICLHLITAVLY